MPAAASRDDRAAAAKLDVRAHARRCLWMGAKLMALVMLLSAVAPGAGEACDASGGGADGGEEARLAARRAALEALGWKASPRIVRSLLPEFPALGVTALSYLET